LDAHRGLARILVAKLYGRRPPKQANQVYGDYIKTPEIRKKASENKRIHGRKVVSSPRGNHYDLEKIFNSLNRQYFSGKLPKPTLTWSSKKTYRILGHHDAAHDTIVVSRSLDTESTPRFVVEYIVFHEMLHVAHPTKHVNGRRYNHTAAFKRDEQKFEFYTEAEKWIERNVRRLEKEAKKKTAVPPPSPKKKKTLKQLVLPFFGRR
ncbi:MAG: SprT-like domain-containing protein, partial [Pyrinomonadaceae bacterium]